MYDLSSKMLRTAGWGKLDLSSPQRSPSTPGHGRIQAHPTPLALSDRIGAWGSITSRTRPGRGEADRFDHVVEVGGNAP